MTTVVREVLTIVRKLCDDGRSQNVTTVVREYDDGRSRRVVCRPRRPRGPLGSVVDSFLLTLGTRSRDSDHAKCEGVSLVQLLRCRLTFPLLS